MKKEDKIKLTADEILKVIKHDLFYQKRLTEPCLKMIEEYSPAQEQSKQEEKYVPFQGCPVCLGEGKLNNNGTTSAIHRICDVCNGAKIIPQFSLPQEQKDKVTGVRAGFEESAKMDAIELNAVIEIQKEIIRQCKRMKCDDEQTDVINDCVTQVATEQLSKALSEYRYFSLLSSKAVEQKEPDGWVKFLNGVQPDYDKSESYEHGFHDAIQLIKDKSPVYFSPPIQEAEHKQEVTGEDQDFIMRALNYYWHDANVQLLRKDLGDMERENFEYQKAKSKELMSKGDLRL